MGLKKRLAIILLVIMLSSSPASAAVPAVEDIAEQLVCQCGCTLILANCNHEGCMLRGVMTDMIAEQLAQGRSAEQIAQFFVEQYGEEVLASPTKKGFNLVVWILPFAAILGGGGVVYFALKAWVRRGIVPEDKDVSEAEEGNKEYQQRLEKELKEFTERGFR